MENKDIITLARELGAAMQKSDEYIRFSIARQAADEDETLQKLITKAEEKEAEAAAAKVLTLKKYGDQCFLPGIRVTAKETTSLYVRKTQK